MKIIIGLMFVFGLCMAGSDSNHWEYNAVGLLVFFASAVLLGYTENKEKM